MKKSIVVASLVMMGSALMAADMGNGWFMGTEFGGMDIKMKATASSGGTTASITDTMNTTYESLKLVSILIIVVFILPSIIKIKKMIFHHGHGVLDMTI